MLVCIIDLLVYFYLYVVGSSTSSMTTLLPKMYIFLSVNIHISEMHSVINLFSFPFHVQPPPSIPCLSSSGSVDVVLGSLRLGKYTEVYLTAVYFNDTISLRSIGGNIS